MTALASTSSLPRPYECDAPLALPPIHISHENSLSEQQPSFTLAFLPSPPATFPKNFKLPSFQQLLSQLAKLLLQLALPPNHDKPSPASKPAQSAPSYDYTSLLYRTKKTKQCYNFDIFILPLRQLHPLTTTLVLHNDTAHPPNYVYLINSNQFHFLWTGSICLLLRDLHILSTTLLVHYIVTFYYHDTKRTPSFHGRYLHYTILILPCSRPFDTRC